MARAYGRFVGVLAGITALTMVTAGCGTGTSRTADVVTESGGGSSRYMVVDGGWPTSDWSLNNLNPNFVGDLDNYALLPLAIANPPKMGNYLPEIASSWQQTPTKITLHLQPNAKWQNGDPVTATDVLDTFEIQGTNGNGLWSQVTGVTTPNAHTVVLNIRKGQPAALVLYNIMGIFPLPASEYSKFLVPGLEKDLLQYYQLEPTNPTAADNSPAGKVISSVFKRAEGLNPTTFVGDGPYEFQKINSNQLQLKKWSGFWDASKIHVPGIEFLSTEISGNTGAYSDLFSGKMDLAQVAMPYNITERWKHTPGANYITSDNYAQFALYFNDKKYPFNNVKVRQAIAYMINRNQVNQVAEGGNSPYATTKIPTGLLPAVQMQYITKRQLDSLNSYKYNPAKATSMLKSMGFKKVKGHWLLPNGKPFTVAIGGPAGWNDSVADTIVMAKEFNDFGIKASSNAVEQPGYWTQQHQGDFDLDWGWGGDGGLNPMAGAANVIGTNLNYSNIGAYAKDPGIGFGPTKTVPGLGKVNVAVLTTHEESVTGPAQWKTLTWDWARFMNKELPYLPLCEKYQQQEFSTARFVWPPRSSSLWTQLAGYDWGGAILVMMERGLVRPK